MTPELGILGARILIVDDQAANVRLLSRLLTEAGYTRVASTMKPTEVCTLHRRDDYDLILLDLQMPTMDGFAVLEALKTNEGQGYLPVMVLTAQPGHKLRALQAGAKDFISKPFDLVEVKTRIHNMLEIRLLYRQLEAHNAVLEQTVRTRTAELRESEARYRSLTELASDWYWEQDDSGEFTKISGPVAEMLGLRAGPLLAQAIDATDAAGAGHAAAAADSAPATEAADAQAVPDEGWDPAERHALHENIAQRRPFLDFLFHRTRGDGSRQQFRVSGQPMFDKSCRYVGYRGVGVEVTAGR